MNVRQLALAVLSLVFACGFSNSAIGSVLVNVYGTGQSPDLNAPDFASNLGLSSGSQYNDIITSTPVGFNLGDGGNHNTAYSDSSINITPDASGGFAWTNSAMNSFFQAGFFENADPQTYTVSGTGLSIQANTNYDLYVFGYALYGSTNETTLDLAYPGYDSGAQTVGYGTGQFAELSFNSGAIPADAFTISISNTTGSAFVGFTNFAIVPVPEPTAGIAVMAMGMVGLRRRRNQPR